MGLLKKITDRVLGKNSTATNEAKNKAELLRRCYFEVMEQRRVMSADPVIAGVTYREGDDGQDTSPDHFEVTFEGGSSTTKLSQFVINGDQNRDGILSDGDMFFDAYAAHPGTSGFHPFLFDAANSRGISAADIVSFSVSDDGLVLTVNMKNFEAGDKLAFTIDVDEVERDRVDKIASGVEFERTLFNATFVDQHYTFADKAISINTTLEDGPIQRQFEGSFFDEYDDLLAEGGRLAKQSLDLNTDNQTGEANRTALALDAYDLVPKPVTISGSVYHDEDADCNRDSTESGIANVKITLQLLNETTGQYSNVANTTTDANGNYQFGLNLNLHPGKYRLIETQPDGFLSVGATTGLVAGVKTGTIANDGTGKPNIISDINIPLGGTVATQYNFCEIKPASIAGNVWHDADDDGFFDANEQGIANVLIQVTRVGAKPGVNNDVFANTAPVFVRTDASGHYSVASLPPGIYEVVEINNYPTTAVNPLAGYIDGKDSVGQVGVNKVGVGSNDRVNQVELCADDHGVEYNFGELKPTSIGGFVSLTTPDGDCLDPSDPNHVGIAGVSIELFNQAGTLVASTKTDASGRYQFYALKPGIYTVVEIQPANYLDAGQSLGTVNGQSQGNAANDKFTAVNLGSGTAGVMYNFCETPPAELCGTVWHDANDNGILDSGEERIGGVVVELFDANGSKISETRTDAQGNYCFKNLYPGEYCVKEIQPASFTDGKDALGVINPPATGSSRVGVMTNDKFCGIHLQAGDKGTQYNFGEIKPGSISGMVHADANGDCIFNAGQGDKPLAGVELILLDQTGIEIARTTTDANGKYAFNNLRPGTYSVREVQPTGYLNGSAMVGKVGGTSRGTAGNDLISSVTLESGQSGVRYDFCEHIPAELCGTVFHDRNNNGLQDSRDEGIANVRMVLTDATGNVIKETLTDASGKYCFKDLIAGEYCVKEFQPTDFADGKDTLGLVNGTQRGEGKNDEACKITVRGGDKGTEYNFGELKLAEISGLVHVDANGDCVFSTSAGDKPLAGVTLELLNSSGAVIATTVTDQNGNYSFKSLLPGQYSIRQTQPENYFSGGEKAGSGGGSASKNLLTGINISSGQKLIEYNFCENETAEIHGRVWEDGPAIETKDGLLPANYRNLRDGIYQAGTDKPLAGVRMQLYYYIDPAALTDPNYTGDLSPRPVTLADVLPGHYAHMGTTDPTARVWVDTMADGEYWFMGLKAGSYIVVQQQPEGYFDSNDTVGTTTGFTYNSPVAAATAPAAVLRTFSSAQLMDAVVNIQVQSGGVSQQNNFSEVRVTQVTPPTNPPLIPPGFPNTPRTPGNPLTPSPGITGFPGLFGSQPSAFTQFIGTARGGSFQTQAAAPSDPYTWHLSVVNGGIPRGEGDGMETNSVWQQAGFIGNSDWNRFEMDQAVWSFTETRGNDHDDIFKTSKSLRFGMLGGTPLAGDFDGDGIDELAVFKDGYWMLDLNRNGIWDEGDLLARLGDAEDRPVVGDWDGDGKDDIGIYGPIWEHDREAIDRDPGLPNPENDPFTKPKNIPPVTRDAAHGARIMKLTTYGRQRADVVDHVFGIGEKELIPVTGDWNGNGIRSIGTFTDGVWQLDMNGDGKFDHLDLTARFGDAGDIPLVGDFNGDGIEQIAVYRAGKWIVDSNGNREMDAADKTFEMGGASDKPVLGDWDGDGIDEPGLYSEQNRQVF